MLAGTRGQIWSLDVVLAAVVFTVALGIILSQAELGVFYSHQEKNANNLEDWSWFASNALVSKPELRLDNGSPDGINVRCHSDDWITVHDFSWLENCLLSSSTGTLSPEELGLPPGAFEINVSTTGGIVSPGKKYNTMDVPSNVDTFSVARRVLFFDTESISEGTIQSCLHASCADKMTTLTVTLWRKSS